jgi:hypothetical protein
MHFMPREIILQRRKRLILRRLWLVSFRVQEDSAMRYGLVLALSICGSVNAWGATVNPGTNLIQPAIAAAAVGETITLNPGVHVITYTISVNKRIILKGNAGAVGSTFIDKYNGTSDAPAIIVEEGAEQVRLENFTLRGRNQGGPGILVYSNSNTFNDVRVFNCGIDTNTGRRSNFILHGSALNVLNACWSNNSTWVGFSQWASSDNVFNSCVADNNGAEGLTIDGGSHNVRWWYGRINGNNNRSRGVGGVGIDGSNGAWVRNAQIDGTAGGKSGVQFQNNVGACDGCIIRDNTISNSAAYGINKRTCSYPVTNTTTTPNNFFGNALGNQHSGCP